MKEKLSHYLRKKRLDDNLKQAEAAKMIGITLYYYSFLENGKVKNPHQSTVQKISDYTGLTPRKIREMLKYEIHE